MNIHQCGGGNVGDMITKPILEHFLNTDVVNVSDKTLGKFVGVGSIVSWAVKEGDTVWGPGLISDQKFKLPKCKVLALRGKLTAQNINSDCNVFGDPGILLSLIYNPEIEKKYKLGIIEHYVDKNLYPEDGHRISVWQNWRRFIEDIKSCENIVSSSLHGCVIAESFGIPCKWVVLSDKVIGNGFKFRDYLSATDRTDFSQPFDLKKVQNGLLETLKNEYPLLFRNQTI